MTDKRQSPPSLYSRLFMWFCKHELHDELQGDLEEEFIFNSQKFGIRKAKRLYRREVLKMIRPSVIKNFSVSKTHYNHIAMLKNYLKTFVRAAKQNLGYSALNVISLATGITACLITILYLQFELSYDNYHQNNKRTYRIALERSYPNQPKKHTNIPVFIAEALEQDYPDITNSVRINRFIPMISASHSEKVISGLKLFNTQSAFFDLFAVDLIYGNPETALKDYRTVVISETTSKKLFGNANPVGETLTIAGNFDYMITGVFKDIPENTHFSSYDLITYWAKPNTALAGKNYCFSYIHLQEHVDPAQFEAKLQTIVDNHVQPVLSQSLNGKSFEEYLAEGNGFRFYLQPLTDIHLRSNLEDELEANGNMTYIYVLGVIVILILSLACVNYVNLSIALYINRIKEIGVRKILGSSRRQLINQFLFESIFMSFIALFIAGLATVAVLPFFSSVIGKNLDLDQLNNIYLFIALITGTILIGVISGSYPSFYLSRLKPIETLKSTARGRKKSAFRKGLIVYQFIVSISLITGTLFIEKQINFILNKDLGYDKEQILVMNNAHVLKKIETFKNELEKHPSIIGSAGSATISSTALEATAAYVSADMPENGPIQFSLMMGDFDYAKVLGMELIWGRYLSGEMASDITGKNVVLNETGFKALGLKEQMEAQIKDSRGGVLNVIGVVKDFNFKSLHSDISPALIRLTSGYQHGAWANYLSIKINTENTLETLQYVEKVWNEFVDDSPPLYYFLDDRLDQLYKSEKRTRALLQAFSTTAILTCCLGLFSLAALTIKQKTKEIGIRKVLGASTSKLINHLSKEFFWLVVIAFCISIPATYYFIDQWLLGFAYRIKISGTPFISAGVFALLIAFFTIIYQVLKASRQNPVDVLRNE